MSIPAIGAVSGVTGTGYLGALDALGATSTAGGAAGAASGTDAAFGAALAGSVDSLQRAQSTSNDLAVKAVTGDLDDVHDYTVASSQAKVALELTAAVRNKAVEAFTEIMRMQA
ncbi:flagellar hook-basal body complex protein FliE [Cellulomonas aerilata]|uniref:flagellar hook-basal body complex protein FliE n=1 Tax=Cellulomonas aerilata TaxID=515326 RepID=UPI0011BF4239|nr:flagellar hook-basal body complex protein FliE [Cellulomonas aerilata]